MRFVACQACKCAIQIGGSPEEVSRLLGGAVSFPCVTPLCSGRMQTVALTGIPRDYHITELPIRSFFRSINGVGSGVGAPASKKRLVELLLSKRIVEVEAEPAGQPERVLLRELVLEDGTRLHFAASAKGACVYYIEEREDERTGVVAVATESGDPNREEAGRASQAGHCRSQSTEGGAGPTRAPELPHSRGVPAVPEASGVRPNDVSGPTEPSVSTNVRL